jgi:acyl-coenzyme A thioesterase 13
LKAVVKCDKCTSPQLETSGAKDRAVGKTLAYTSIQFTNAKGEIAARGSHTKYVANTYTRDSSSGIH